MIGFLRGHVAAKTPPHLVVDVNGVGYEIEVPMTTCLELPEVGAEIHLVTHLIVREDQHTLYGFANEATGAEDPALFLRHHIIRIVLGFMLLVLFIKVREDVLRRLAKPLLIAALVLLGLVLVPSPLSVEVRGSARWLHLGYFVFQPSELAKIALIVYLADFITRRGYDIRKFSRGFVPAFIVVGTAVVLVAAEPNIGTAAMLLLIGIVVLFAGGARIEHLGRHLPDRSGGTAHDQLVVARDHVGHWPLWRGRVDLSRSHYAGHRDDCVLWRLPSHLGHRSVHRLVLGDRGTVHPDRLGRHHAGQSLLSEP